MNLNLESDEKFFEQLSRGHGLLQNLWQQERTGNDDADTDALHYRPEKSRSKSSNLPIVGPGPVGAAAARAAIANGNIIFWHTVVAKVVSGHRNGQPLGNVGLALLIQTVNNVSDVIEGGNNGIALDLTNNNCGVKLTVYRSKYDILCTMELRPARGFGNAAVPYKLILKTNQLHFDDTEKLAWRLGFQNNEDGKEFLKQLRDLYINVQVEEDDTEDVLTTTNKSSIHKKKSFVSKEPVESRSSDESSSATEIKTQLISRMSRVGQALPNLTCNNERNATGATNASATTDKVLTNSDSEMEVIITPRAQPRTYAPQAVATAAGTVNPNTTSTLAGNAVMREYRQYHNNINNHHINNENQHSRSDVIHNDLMQLLCTEQRNENCELRLNMSKMDFKLDKVLDKLERLERNGQQSTSYGGGAAGDQTASLELLRQRENELIALDEKLLALRKENLQLKQQLADAANNMATQKHNNVEIEFNVLQKYGSQLIDIKLLQPGQTQLQLDELIGKLLDELKHAQLPCPTCNTLALSTGMTSDEIVALKRNHQDMCKENERLTATLTDLTHQQTKDKEAYEQRFQTELAERIHTSTEQKLKHIVNSIYGVLMDKLPPEEHELLGLIGKTIKDLTVKLMTKDDATMSSTNTYAK